MFLRHRCSGCGWTPGFAPHHQEQDVRPHHRVPRCRRGVCMRPVDKLLVLPEHFGETSYRGQGWDWFSLSFPSCAPPGSDGDCWADHHGHGEGRAAQGRVYKEDLDGWLQGADRQGVKLRRESYSAWDCLPYMRSRSSRYFCFLFIHKQFKNKEVGIGVKKKQTEERDTGMNQQVWHHKTIGWFYGTVSQSSFLGKESLQKVNKNRCCSSVLSKVNMPSASSSTSNSPITS